MNLEDFTKEEIISALKRMPSFILAHNEDELIRKLFITRYETESRTLIDKMNKNVAEASTISLNPDYQRQIKRWTTPHNEYIQLNKKFSKLEKWSVQGQKELFK